MSHPALDGWRSDDVKAPRPHFHKRINAIKFFKTTRMVLIALLFSASPLSAQDYTIDLKADGNQLAIIDLSIKDDEATTKVDGVEEHFDLKNQRWLDSGTGEWFSLEQCETWAKQSKAKSKQSIATLPGQMRPFAKWSLDPTFTVETTETGITLTSGQVDYVITATKTDGDLTTYMRYARLNAYKKAMTQGEMPPFVELKVLETLEQHGLMPTAMAIEIPGIPEAPAFTMRITEKQP